MHWDPEFSWLEIQETSDTTYRIYDWDRLDEEGQSREMHTEEAMDALDLNVYDEYKTQYGKKEDTTVNLESCKHFTTNLVHLMNHSLKKDLEGLDSFVAYICIKGSCELIYDSGKENIIMGDTILVPAMFGKHSTQPENRNGITGSIYHLMIGKI